MNKYIKSILLLSLVVTLTSCGKKTVKIDDSSLDDLIIKEVITNYEECEWEETLPSNVKVIDLSEIVDEDQESLKFTFALQGVEGAKGKQTSTAIAQYGNDSEIKLEIVDGFFSLENMQHCSINLSSLNKALASYTYLNNLRKGDSVSWVNLKEVLVEIPECPRGGEYTLSTEVNLDPEFNYTSCSCGAK